MPLIACCATIVAVYCLRMSLSQNRYHTLRDMRQFHFSAFHDRSGLVSM